LERAHLLTPSSRSWVPSPVTTKGTDSGGKGQRTSCYRSGRDLGQHVRVLEGLDKKWPSSWRLFQVGEWCPECTTSTLERPGKQASPARQRRCSAISVVGRRIGHIRVHVEFGIHHVRRSCNVGCCFRQGTPRSIQAQGCLFGRFCVDRRLYSPE